MSPISTDKNNNTSALALSGGGYRATLFALGSLWRLNELGRLNKLKRITGVSGGSITLGYLALNWNELDFDEVTGIATNFEAKIAKPLLDFCSKDLDIAAAISGLLSPFNTIGDKIAQAYDKQLFNKAQVQNLPSGEGIPEFIFYATNYDTGSSVRISKNGVFDYKIGTAPIGDLLLSTAVGASSSFPPIFSPVVIDSSTWEWQRTEFAHADLYDFKDGVFRKRLVLADGGLYDNLGVEAIWKTDPNSPDYFDEVFACDAGAPLTIGFGTGDGFIAGLLQKTGLYKNWGSQLLRMSDIMIEQQRALRKRQLIDNFKKGIGNGGYSGSYWGIKTKIADYGHSDKALASDTDISAQLSTLPTRLKAFSAADIAHLVNWGYALTDAAIRRDIDPSIPTGSQPIPEDAL